VRVLPQRKESLFYTECYEYDSSRNLTRVANNFGELTDYTYQNNLVKSAVEYDFETYIGDTYYPYEYSNPDEEIEKTPKLKTDYTYNTYGLCTLVKTYEVDENLAALATGKTTQTSYTYKIGSASRIFGALAYEMDSLGVYTYYYYDAYNGRLLATIRKGSGKGVCYTYDTTGKLTGVYPASYSSNTSYSRVTNAENVGYTYNAQNQLTSISTNSTTYTFSYDAYHNPTSTKVGSNSLATYSYNANNGKVNKITYGNGFIVEYVYDRLENISEIWYTDSEGVKSLAYSYEYTSDGQVYKLTDHINGKETSYKYDINNRMVSFIEYDIDDMKHDFSSKVSYDAKGQLDLVEYRLNFTNGSIADCARFSSSYFYNADGSLKRMSVSNAYALSGRETLTYDTFDRLTRRLYSMTATGSSASFRNQVDYTYRTNGSKISDKIASYSSTINDGTATVYTFTYGQNEQITKIVYSTGEEVRYYYDDRLQLVREDNPFFNKTYVMTYDRAGNITKKEAYAYTASGTTPINPTSTSNYTYGNSAWGDQLTAYKGTAITYDSLGNPLSYYNGVSRTFTWDGSLMKSAVKGSYSLTFGYNSEGMRTSKTVNGTTTNYYYDGSLLIAEERNNNVTIYVYDSTGQPIGFQYHGASYAENSWDVFWFEKNYHGDIVAVYSDAGTKLISYKYDAWGGFTTGYHNGGASTKATVNPFKYRGYYYDTHLSLYYLGSRYYDSQVGRFINADSALYHSMLGYNMYAYCNNNPIMYVDYTGANAKSIMDAWTLFMGVIASVEPTVIGEAILVAGVVVIVAVSIGETIVGEIRASKVAYDTLTPPQHTTENTDNSYENVSSIETKTKEDVDPHRRPGQKKQGIELKKKARRKGSFEDRSNKRHGREKPKKHTPGRGHKKYFNLEHPIKIF